jgi:DNA repair protein RadD
MKQARPHQTTAHTQILSAYDRGLQSVCYQLATGGGKSFVIRKIIEHFHDQKKVIYLVTHRREILRQLAREMADGGMNFSIVSPGFPMIKTRLRICMIQTLVRRVDRMDEPELIVIDECQHLGANSYRKILDLWPNARILGVSATPARTDGQRLPFEVIIPGPPMRTLINQGYLSPYAYYAPPTVSAEGLHIARGEYVTSESESRVDTRVITGDAIEHYRKHADHQPAIASCVSIAHAEHVAVQFREAGYRAQAIHSKLPEEQIERLMHGLRSGLIEILCQCDMLGEGVDIPGASVLIGLRPTASLTIYLQHIGRVLRYVAGKTAIIIDHVDNISRHGLPDIERIWGLDGTVKIVDGQLLYKRCPDCYRGDVPKRSQECPYCGHKFTGLDAARSRLPDQKDGELVLVSESGLHHIEEFQESHIKKARSRIAQAATVEQAREIAEEFGYKRKFGDIVWNVIRRKRRSA